MNLIYQKLNYESIYQWINSFKANYGDDEEISVIGFNINCNNELDFTTASLLNFLDIPIIKKIKLTGNIAVDTKMIMIEYDKLFIELETKD